MPVIGLTGGIASGKSTVADLLRARGAVVIDADGVAREVVRPGEPALEEIVSRFGRAVLSADGSLDRGTLGRLVFADPVALGDLNAILHPRIFEALRARLTGEDLARPVFVEAALLAETYSQAAESLGMETLVVVDAPVELQVARLEAKGMSRADALLRIAAQMDRAERLRRASFVIDNSGSLDDLRREVERVWARLRK